MKIGYNGSTAIKRSNLEMDMELCEKYGFDCMEFRMSILDDYFKRGGTVEKIQEFFKKSRLKPHAMNSLEFFNMKSRDEFEKIKIEFDSMCKLTRKLGSDLVIVVPSFDVAGTIEEVKENTVECLRQFSAIAGNYGVRVGFEFIGFKHFCVNNFTQAYEIIQAVDRENVGCVVDLYHFFIYGSRIEDLRKADGKKIFMVHINDIADKPIGTLDSDKYRLMPGDGIFPYKELFEAFCDIGYRDIVSVELFNPEVWDWDPEKAVRTAKLKCESIIDKY